MYTTVSVFFLRLQCWHWINPEYFCFDLAFEASSANTGKFTTLKVSLCSTQLLVLVADPKWLQAWHRLKLTTSPASDDDKDAADDDDDEDDDGAITCEVVIDLELGVRLEGGWGSQQHCTEQ